MGDSLMDASPGIWVLSVEEENLAGTKGSFGPGLLAIAAWVPANQIALSLEEFCNQLMLILDHVGKRVGEFDLETVEVAAEITGKGEVRLLGSAGVEVKGGLKLSFRKRA